MNKILLLLVLLIPIYSPAKDNNSIKIISGDPQVLFQSGKSMSITFDYSGLHIEGYPAMEYLKIKGEDYLRDFPRDNIEAEEWFVGRWNHEKDKYVLIKNESPVDLKMRIHITEMDLGSAGAAFWGISRRSGGLVISGRVYVKDMNNKNLLTILFMNYKARTADMMSVENGKIVYKKGYKNHKRNDNFRRKVGYLSFAEDLMEALENPQYADKNIVLEEEYIDNNEKCSFLFKDGIFVSSQETGLNYVIYDAHGMSQSDIKGALKLAPKSDKSLGDIETISDNVLQLNGYGKNVFESEDDHGKNENDISFSMTIQLKDEKIRYNKPVINKIVRKNSLGEEESLNVEGLLKDMIPNSESSKIEKYFKDLINKLNNSIDKFTDW